MAQFRPYILALNTRNFHGLLMARKGLTEKLVPNVKQKRMAYKWLRPTLHLNSYSPSCLPQTTPPHIVFVPFRASNAGRVNLCFDSMSPFICAKRCRGLSSCCKDEDWPAFPKPRCDDISFPELGRHLSLLNPGLPRLGHLIGNLLCLLHTNVRKTNHVRPED